MLVDSKAGNFKKILNLRICELTDAVVLGLPAAPVVDGFALFVTSRMSSSDLTHVKRQNIASDSQIPS